MDEMSPVAPGSEMVSTPSRGPTAGRCEVEKKTGVTMTTGQYLIACSIVLNPLTAGAAYIRVFIFLIAH